MNFIPGSRLWNLELFADSADRPFLNFAMTRDAGNLPALRVEPNSMGAALSEEDATLLTQVSLQVRKLHTSASSIVSRTAFGERFSSASSRWHSSTSLSASRRFAFASSSVSPCEMAAGISSTKQVYPPSLAGSKIAVNFMRLAYHARAASQTWSERSNL